MAENALNTINCTVTQCKCAADSVYSSSFEDWEDASGVGYFTNTYRVTWLSFMTSGFSGVSNNINIILPGITGHNVGFSMNVRYALLSSASNIDEYRLTANEVDDENQIISGIWNVVCSADYSCNISINTSLLIPNTEYHLVFWASQAVDSEDNNFSFTTSEEEIIVALTYKEIDGIVYIDNLSSYYPYQCYIDNGTAFEPCIIYIDNSTSWKTL